jgi:hypothetical protein
MVIASPMATFITQTGIALWQMDATQFAEGIATFTTA